MLARSSTSRSTLLPATRGRGVLECRAAIGQTSLALPAVRRPESEAERAVERDVRQPRDSGDVDEEGGAASGLECVGVIVEQPGDEQSQERERDQRDRDDEPVSDVVGAHCAGRELTGLMPLADTKDQGQVGKQPEQHDRKRPEAMDDDLEDRERDEGDAEGEPCEAAQSLATAAQEHHRIWNSERSKAARALGPAIRSIIRYGALARRLDLISMSAGEQLRRSISSSSRLTGE